MNCRENRYIFLTPSEDGEREGVDLREGEREREAGRGGGARAKPGNQLVVNKMCGWRAENVLEKLCFPPKMFLNVLEFDIQLFVWTLSPMHHRKTRQLGRQHASCHLQSFNDTFSIGRREEVLLDWNFVQCLQEYQIYKQLLLFDLAACTIWKEVDAVNCRVLCFQASDYFG